MLKVILYQNSPDVFDFSFLKDRNRPLLIVTPNPNVADFNRKQLQGKGDALTISKFVGDLLQQSEIVGQKKIMRKSEILLWLATVWKSTQKNPKYELFINAFNTFTDLRSFTMESGFLSELDQFLDPEMTKAIQYFWMIFENQEIHDEHSAYFELADFVRHKEYDDQADEKNIVFNGFNFLSGNQIDFINALAIRSDVYIPFPKAVYDQCKQSDWIRWINGEVEFLETKNHPKVNKVELFSRNNKNELLERFYSSVDNSNYQIALAHKKPEFELISKFARGDLNYKAGVNIFKEYLESVSKRILEEILARDKKSKTSEILKQIESDLISEIENGHKDFRKIKVIQEYLKTISSYQELSEINESMTPFDVSLIREVVGLNLPRNSIYGPGEKGKIVGVESLEFLDRAVKTLFIAENGFNGFSSSESSQQEELWDFYKAIGPIRRNSLETEFYSFQLNQLMENSNDLTLLIESDLAEHDVFWSKFVNGQSVNIAKVENKEKSVQYALEKISGKINFPISVSHLQAFLDCPMKYYYESVLRIKPFLKMKEQIQPNEIGSLEHKIIETYFKEKRSDLNALVMECWNKYKNKNKIVASRAQEKKVLLELLEFSQNAINTLVNLNFDNSKYEHDFRHDKLSGSIDCVLHYKDKILLIDFKRSDSSIPKKKELLDFSKIQLWAYSLVSQIEFGKKAVGLGYINLSDPKESLFILSPECSSIKDRLDLMEIKNSIIDFDSELLNFDSFIKQKMESLVGDINFLARPSSKKVCQFCSLKTICHKGEQ